MTDNKQYWDQLISKGLRFLQDQSNDAAAAVLKKATFDVEHRYHDSWRWGTDYWDLVLHLKYRAFMALGDNKEQVEKDIMSALVTFEKGSRDLLSTVSIRPLAEQNMDWTEAVPLQKAAEDAELFIREGKYDDAYDRIYTAFSDYMKYVQQSDVGDRTKDILLSTGGILDAINEARNDSTAAHPDGQRVEKREAQLAVGLINSIAEYVIENK